MAEGKKRGPKTDNPKLTRISAKLDKEAIEILDQYCDSKKVSKMEAVRRGIKKLKEDLE